MQLASSFLLAITTIAILPTTHAFTPHHQQLKCRSSSTSMMSPSSSSALFSSTMEDTETDTDMESPTSTRRKKTGKNKRTKQHGFTQSQAAHANANGHAKAKTKTYKEIKDFRKAKDTFVSTAQSSFEGNSVNGRSKPASTSSPGSTSSSGSRASASKATNKEQEYAANEQEDHSEDVKARIHNINNIRSSRTFEEKKRSSERMNKAQLLLKDLSNEGTMPDVQVSKQKTTVAPSSSSSSSSPSLSSTMDPSSTETATVLDQVWYNGNLERGQGDFVTRWSKGVKVAEPLRKYDPVAAEKLLFLQPAKWIIRNVQIAFPLGLWAFGVATDVIQNKEEEKRTIRAKQLLNTISGLGPAIIKGGQALASRSDLMPSEYLDQLVKLQDDVPRFDNGLAFATVEGELGAPFEDVFELVEPEPIAAASIGQVYKARLRSNGDLVAIKIQRPKCEEIIALDLYVLRWWSGVANVLTKLLNRDINVQSIIDDFGELIYRELDYVAEAANAQRFSELYAGQVKDVFVPKVYSDLTTSKVLTMEWVEGFRLTDGDKLDEYGLDRKKLIDTLVQCSLRQILGNGEFGYFFHLETIEVVFCVPIQIN